MNAHWTAKQSSSPARPGSRHNLVRALVARGAKVKALARSVRKAEQQFAGIEGVAIVQGDMTAVGDFASHLEDARFCSTLRHISATATPEAITRRAAGRQL